MAELKRKEEQLTTADLAGRADAQDRTARDIHEVATPERPKPVRGETDLRTREHSATVTANANTAAANPPHPAATPSGATDTAPASLFSESDVNDLRGRWSNVQTGFVDEPRRAVEEADKLVATVMQRLAEGFANERSNLEKAWDRGDNVSTEDLRVALRRYRSFFDRLLNA